MAPDTRTECAVLATGARSVVGLDEAGRGCWAGPVVAAAVVLPPALLHAPAPLAHLDDSKRLTAARRAACYTLVLTQAAGVGVGVVPAYLIDALGIVPATHLAMTVALLALPCPAEYLLIDALRLPGVRLPQQAIIRGDAQVLSIAAASVVAKVTRDRLMTQADMAFAGYGFAAHKGYGTAYHRQALTDLGVCSLHRRSFRPIAQVCAHSSDTGVSGDCGILKEA